MNRVVSQSVEGMRKEVLAAAREFKASWLRLGQYLYTVFQDKLYKSWGFLTFEGYCMKELGIKQTTAAKLLKSYSFLEKEEPRLTAIHSGDGEEEASPRVIPHYESVNLLRLARENKKISPREFSDLREAVLNEGKEPREVKAKVKEILAGQEEGESAEAKRIKRESKIKRLASFLKSAKKDLEQERLLPDYLVKQIGDLIGKLEDQLEQA